MPWPGQSFRDGIRGQTGYSEAGIGSTGEYRKLPKFGLSFLELDASFVSHHLKMIPPPRNSIATQALPHHHTACVFFGFTDVSVLW